MKHVIAQLEINLDVMTTNEPINRNRGDEDQANLEAVTASEIRQALAILKAVDAGPIWPEPTGCIPVCVSNKHGCGLTQFNTINNMTTKHTPAPWALQEHSWSDTSIVNEEREKVVAILSIYAEATEKNQQELESEMDANAHLIAAAPDMYEALKEAHKYLINAGLVESECVRELIQLAINKAEGSDQ